MNKSFDYLYELVSQDSINIEDIGNTCIHILNDLGYEWYMLIYTDLGTSYIKTMGPFYVDNKFFSKGFKFEYYSFQYSESKLSTKIDNFINDPKKLVTQAFICNEDEFFKKLKEINFKEMR